MHAHYSQNSMIVSVESRIVYPNTAQCSLIQGDDANSEPAE